MRNMRQTMIVGLIALVAIMQFPTMTVAQELPPEVRGCMTPGALNFNPLATVDDGSCVMIPAIPPFPIMPPPVGSIEITDPTDNEVLTGFQQFSGTFVDAVSTTINDITYRITTGTCSSDGVEMMSGQMFNTNGSLAVTLNLDQLEVGEYCFTVRALAIDSSETSVSDQINFSIVDPSYVSILSPYGTVNGIVNFSAEVFSGTPELTENLDWSIYSGDCDDQGTLVAGNVGGFENAFTYIDGQFNAELDTTGWAEGQYCLKVNPHEAGDVADTVYTFSTFFVGFNTISGQKYEDVDGDKRLNYEIDRLVPDYPIIATNIETGEVRETTTDEYGTYTFALPTGIWTISEGEVRGWKQIRAYEGFILIDEGDYDDGDSLDCTIFAGERGEMRLGMGYGKGSACTFLNERVSVSSGGGTRVRPPSNTATGQVLGAATSTPVTCEGMYLTAYMREGQDNPADQVTRLQLFLTALGFTTDVTGVFDASTTAAVRRFQEQYLRDVLTPWGITEGTGYVFKTTRATINNLVCPGSEPTPVI